MRADDHQSVNFGFLKEHDPVYLQLASMAEQVFANDPNTTLIKLRQLGEAFARDIAARCGVPFDDQTKHVDLLYRLNRQLGLDDSIRNIFHTLRIEGNDAITPARENKKNQTPSGKTAGKGLVENQKRMLVLISENARISKRKMAEEIGISTTAVDKNIEALKSKGLLKRIGPAKGGYWEVLR